jgi:uncharacterized protein (DUF433 family)
VPGSGTVTRRRLLNAGIYDVAEVARLAKMDPETVSLLVTPRRGEPPLLDLENPPFLTFHDLISAYVIHELRRRRVRLKDIREGARFLRRALGTERPFAHQRLATVGTGFFAGLPDAGRWLDAGQGGQAAFDDVIQPLIRPIEYGRDSMASAWYPQTGISIDPRIQAGAPCVRGTRVPTSLIASLLEAEETQASIAEQFRLTKRQVMAAKDYEFSLAA